MRSYQQVQDAAGQNEAKSQYELALMFELGLGVAQDLKQAFVWYEKSAQQDYPQAQYNLGVFYALGKGVDKDIQQAKHWIRTANENGYCGTGVFLKKA